MITKVKVRNRDYMDLVAKGLERVPFEKWHLISVCSRKEEELLTPSVCRFMGDTGVGKWLSLIFMDITPEHLSEKLKRRYPWAKLFDELQASQVIAFVDAIHKLPEESVLVIHCDAGISRSGAIGTWVVDYLGLDYHTFIKEHPHIFPNPHVMSVLRKKSGMNTSAFGIIIPEAKYEI